MSLRDLSLLYQYFGDIDKLYNSVNEAACHFYTDVMQGFVTVPPVPENTAHVGTFYSCSFEYQCIEAQHDRGHELCIAEVPLAVPEADLCGLMLTLAVVSVRNWASWVAV